MPRGGGSSPAALWVPGSPVDISPGFKRERSVQRWRQRSLHAKETRARNISSLNFASSWVSPAALKMRFLWMPKLSLTLRQDVFRKSVLTSRLRL
ncbi:hypothetical protein Y1Q_0007195 [Alligator mississippiensis]|uniref:Uncharacterized protein n=1 Tax=Alligator mississippiensis TaxID=8496 RepID=A0A151N5V6_ALLMI|nr:hypothetical protein Y1Q_0007195 [Alligator mississippiensis]